MAPQSVGPARAELLRWPATEFDGEAQAVLREAAWRARRSPGRGTTGSGSPKAGVHRSDDRPGWTPAVRAMVAGTLAATRDSGAPFSRLPHLLLGMFALPGCDGTRALYVSDDARLSAVERLRGEPDLHLPGTPHPDMDLEGVILSPGTGDVLLRLGRRLLVRLFRLGRTGALFAAVPVEARRQAVRLGHNVIGPAHVLLAMLTLDATLRAAGITVPTEQVGRNRGAALLGGYGLTVALLHEAAVRSGAPGQPSAELLVKQLQRMRPGDPFEGVQVTTAIDRARQISLSCGHPDTGTSHLLLALVEDDASDAAIVLRELGVDTTALRDSLRLELGVPRDG